MGYHRTAAADETAVAVRTGRTILQKVTVRQRTIDAPVLYLQLFNVAAGSVTVGTTAPDDVIKIPAGRAGLQFTSRKVINAYTSTDGPYGTALSFAVTTTHDGATGPDAGDEPEVIIKYGQ